MACFLHHKLTYLILTPHNINNPIIMDTKYLKRISTLMIALAFVAFASAQNKDIDKGNELLKKGMEQADPAKRNELIQKAIESYQKGGMKKEMYALIGDAYLEKRDYTNASSNYSRCDKEQKAEGMKKIAEAYVEDAHADSKAEAKNLKKAMDFFTKANAAKEGARYIGDKFYEKGIEFYPKALDYYVTGEASVKIEQIAREYFEKGGDNQVKAAEAYARMKNRDGYKKAGDIYYNRKEYQKAIDAYLAGGVGEGIQKYADMLYAEHRDEEADALILKLADAYSEKKDEDALEKLGKGIYDKGSYKLASQIYDKAGNMTMADKNRAFDALVNFRLEEARSTFEQVNDAAMAKMITDNEKVLYVLKDVADVMAELQRGAPFVTLIIDSLSGRSYPSPSDQKMQEDYYKSIRDQVINNVYSVANNFGKITNPELKKYVRRGFLKYGAVRSILDPETFTIKKQKQDIKVKDVIL